MKTMLTGLVLGSMVVAGVYTDGHDQALSLYHSQLAACNRGNVVRVTLHDFLQEAAGSRRTLAALTHGAVRVENLRAEKKYANWAHKFHRLDCKSVVAKP